MGGSPPKGEDIGSFVRSHENDTEQNQTRFDCFDSLNKLAEYTSDQEETENNKGAEQDGKGKGAEPEKVSSSGINVHTNLEEKKQINEILRDSSNKILEFRLRGNRCYDEGNFVKAEELYTKGITCLQANERSYCLQALALCYSNRAAARMSLLKLRDAIEDCRSAMDSDHNFSKAQIRAGHCHLQLGELKNAMEFFEKYLATVNVDCLDKKVTLHAVEGQQNTQKVAQYIEQSMELLAQKSTDAVASALELISKALAIAPYSERLLRMKAESLIMLEKHAEAIVLCEQTFSFAENNFPIN
ncbi:N-terminal acetyltransferase A, auxiliary subunit [Trema orientale]|uniref:N-terminal acetyltransferase A, auxiliary subunit n=1 Tax=Trema orientale TaxID=63057 RepID=A0A2P5B1D4_TREOI|nr:N-terminal acetyltransferase A, auxiliary subunit [Trema orientale]